MKMHSQGTGGTKQQRLLERWIPLLAQIPEIEAIWLEGSLVDGERATPASDVDISIAITDEAYVRLWEDSRAAILDGLGEHLLLVNTTWVRAITADAVVVELSVHRTSQLNNLELYEWRFLLCRLPEGEPQFKKLPEKSPAELWPHPEELTVEKVRQLTDFFLLVLAQVPAPFYNEEIFSARFVLDDMRTELIKLMYRRVGLRYAKRYKHLSEVLLPEFLADIEYTHTRYGELPLDAVAIGDATLRTFEMIGKHLRELGAEAGGGFESESYFRLHSQTEVELNRHFHSLEGQNANPLR